MIFVPLLHYFLCKNDYSGNEAGLRYRLTPGKRTVPDPDGGADATKEEKILTVDYWPAPWTIDKTDPALRRREAVSEGRLRGRAGALEQLPGHDGLRPLGAACRAGYCQRINRTRKP